MILQKKCGKDTLFDIEHVGEDFVFNERVVEVFDDMVNRSIPFYTQVIESSAQLLARYLEDGDRIYDLGCSTGSTLLELARILAPRKLEFHGVDNSKAMLDKARLKVESFRKQSCISFHQQDITHFLETGVGAILLNYTLQFIRPLQRQQFLQQLYTSLRPGGVVLISEKVINHDQRLNREFIHLYYQFKKARGYSELEIARKREALENILIPFSIEENIAMLKSCGFTTVATFFQWFNFCSLVAVKPINQTTAESPL